MIAQVVKLSIWKPPSEWPLCLLQCENGVHGDQGSPKSLMVNFVVSALRPNTCRIKSGTAFGTAVLNLPIALTL